MYTCELCGKQYASSQAKWMHKHRSHPSGTVSATDLEARMIVLEKRISDLQVELDTVRDMHKTMTNNSFSPSINMISYCENVTIHNHSSSATSYSPAVRQLSIDDMHPFDDDNFEEFISAAQFQECGYSLVKLLQLSHFNPAFPEYMNFIQIPSCSDKAYVLGKDRRWVKVDFHSSFIALLYRLVNRVKKLNPAEASKYDDETSLFIGGMESISLKAMQGISMYSHMCVRKLSEMGICLPGDVV